MLLEGVYWEEVMEAVFQREIFGADLYHWLGAFIVYSMLGWLVESIYMSFWNRRLTNRGFGKGPFCPIYGVGALVGYLILSPFYGNLLQIYLLGAVAATLFEYLVGRGMQRYLGAVWWDYHDKPFNYQGIICLESTVAWGFYALGIVMFLQDRVFSFVEAIPMEWGLRLIALVFLGVFVDYSLRFLEIFQVDLKSKRQWFLNKFFGI